MTKSEFTFAAIITFICCAISAFNYNFLINKTKSSSIHYGYYRDAEIRIIDDFRINHNNWAILNNGKPFILISKKSKEMTDSQLRSVLAHEYGHVLQFRRGDYPELPALSMMLTVPLLVGFTMWFFIGWPSKVAIAFAAVAACSVNALPANAAILLLLFIMVVTFFSIFNKKKLLNHGAGLLVYIALTYLLAQGYDGSRALEIDADLVAARLAPDDDFAGWQKRAGIFEKIAPTHPPAEERIAAFNSEVAKNKNNRNSYK